MSQGTQPVVSSCLVVILVWTAWCWSVHLGGVLLTCLGVDGISPYRVIVVGLPCGSAVVLNRILPVVWSFSYWYLLLLVIPFLSDWGLPCSTVIRRLSCWIDLVGTVLLHLVWRSSALTSFGLWFCLTWCLVIEVSCRLSLIVCQTLFI